MAEGPEAGGAPQYGQAPEQREDALARPREERAIAGVCVGLGRYTDVDPVIYRVTFGLFTVVGGLGVLLYALGWLLIPEKGSTVSEAERLLGRRLGLASNAPVIVIVIVGLVVLGFFASGFGAPVITVLAVGAVAALAARARGTDLGAALRGLTSQRTDGHAGRQRAAQPDAAPQTTQTTQAPQAPQAPPSAGPSTPGVTPPATQPLPGSPAPPDGTRPFPAWHGAPSTPPGRVPPPPATHPRPQPRPRRSPSPISLLTLAAAVTVGGTLAGLNAAHLVTLPFAATLGAVLVILGLGLLATTWRGGSPLLVTSGTIVALTLVVGSASMTYLPAAVDTWGTRVGEARWQPHVAQELHDPYRLVAGEGRLDLTKLGSAGQGRQPEQGEGQRLPSYTATARVGMGELRVTLPRDARVTVRTRMEAGAITLPKTEHTGTSVEVKRTLRPPAGEQPHLRIHLNLRVGTGELKVRYAQP